MIFTAKKVFYIANFKVGKVIVCYEENKAFQRHNVRYKVKQKLPLGKSIYMYLFLSASASLFYNKNRDLNFFINSNERFDSVRSSCLHHNNKLK